MKKLLSILFLIPLFFLASCVNGDEDLTDTEDNNYSSADNGSNDTGDNTGDDNQPSAECGNKIVDSGEACDGNAQECISIDSVYTGGYAMCKSDCSGWDMTGCKTNENNGDADSGDPDQADSDIPLNCTGVSFDSDSFGMSSSAVFYADIDSDLGESSLPDDIRFEFFLDDGKRNEEIKPGEYDLGTGRNTNYSTCNECLTIHQDITSYSPFEAKKVFFQKTGTMKIESVDEENFIEGTVSAKLVEVIIDNANHFTSTPVPDGSCLEIETGTFKKNAPKECKKITIDPLSIVKVDSNGGNFEYTASYSPNSDPDDKFTLKIKDTVYFKRTFNLSGARLNDKYGIFFLISEASGKKFFQEKGVVEFLDFDTNSGTFSSVTLDSVKLVEVEINEEKQTSAPIPGGECFEIVNTTLECTEE